MLIYISVNSASQALYASSKPTIYYFDISPTKFNIIKDKFNGKIKEYWYQRIAH